MKREFHIFASRMAGQFIMKGVGEGYPRVFTSLFEAARHARTLPGCEGGLLVIYDEEEKAVNRIPFEPLKLN